MWLGVELFLGVEGLGVEELLVRGVGVRFLAISANVLLLSFATNDGCIHLFTVFHSASLSGILTINVPQLPRNANAYSTTSWKRVCTDARLVFPALMIMSFM